MIRNTPVLRHINVKNAIYTHINGEITCVKQQLEGF